MGRKMRLSDQLREAIEASEHSRNAIGKATGVDPAVLCHFVAGRRGMSLESVDRLCEFLDLELRPRRSRSMAGR